ncbi:autotransporter Pta [Proteus myxofaciens]|uniref:Subtilisin-related family S8 peptidase n=1 Tax=Proteus myxofaciens ATCC 19692 TaxID=1354337 RepID=A0A198G9B9_9GAMM|nr:autotransporter Pta [Proteus myxofaciens]OAT33678.1 subtilisin-related family S8 peptidase [Proteus myxofaciens ATCC 19692]
MNKKIALNHHRYFNNSRSIHNSIFKLSLVASALLFSGNSIAYAENGQLGNKQSWESQEYKKDWGLAAMKASSAYALGYHGQGANIGVMDSGALLSHPELSGERFHAVKAKGEYGTTGMRYPQDKGGHYKKGESFGVDGAWIKGVNDTHGTHVTGTVGANRDGNGMHGVAWGANIYIGNTGATDSNNYGPYQDYQYFYTGWKAIVDAGAQVINNSWGTNTRIINNIPTYGIDGGNTTVHLPVDTTAQTEYEYFYFKKVYGDNPSFVDAAYDAVKNTNVVQVFTTGNRDFAQPYYRALYPYFNPEAEKHWITVAGLEQNADKSGYVLIKRFNEAGNAKWWTVVAPGRDIYSSIVDEEGKGDWASFSGTSMAAPHVTGAMGVLMSRYSAMSAMQVRDVMFTTASHRNPDGSLYNSWTASEGTPDVRYGWGTPDLDKGMYGPGQFLGKFEYQLDAVPLDVWTNDISQTALDLRKKEDLAWLKEYQEKGIKAGGDYELGANLNINDGTNDPNAHIINKEDAEKWRKEYYQKRADTIQEKINLGLYNGTLIKKGEGTLVLTGDNTYRGGTIVEQGSLLGFTESFGTEAINVNGGKLSIVEHYNDTFTGKGELTSNQTNKANININDKGTYLVAIDHDVNVSNMSLNNGANLDVGAENTNQLKDIYLNNQIATGSVNADNLVDNRNKTKMLANNEVSSNSDYALFDKNVSLTNNTITGTLSKKENTSLVTFANNENGRSIANTLENHGSGELFNTILPMNKQDLTKTYDSLGSDMYLNANNASVVNILGLTRTVKDQAMGIGHGRSASLENSNARIWITGIGQWGKTDYGHSNMDVDFYVGLLGAEINVADNTKAGLFFGAGTTKYKGNESGKIDSNDIHIGAYGISNLYNVISLNYGITHTNQDREAKRTLWVGQNAGYNSTNYDAKITQLFLEGAYTQFNTQHYSIEPYLGFNWLRVSTDNINEHVGNMSFATHTDSQNIQVGTIGLRGGYPFTAGNINMAVKGDISASHLFGDNRPESRLFLSNSGDATLRGGKLDNLFGVGLGIDAQLSRSTTLGLYYQGQYNSDIHSSGINTTLKINF